MTWNGWLQIAVFVAIVVALVKPVGLYMTKVFSGERTWLSPVLRPIERAFYAVSGVRENEDQHWLAYAFGMLLFNAAGCFLLYAILRLQAYLPLNPQGFGNLSPDLAFNTAISFTTNTNWQNYVGESTMSYLSQMAGLTVHNFVSAATGIALAVALIRGFARRSAQGIGNFWVDMTRCCLYILLPISIAFALFLVWQGMPQNLGSYVTATTLDGAKQTIAQGPVASQIAIKMLGTNGGGFFNANAAHPYENPTPLSNFIQMLSIFLIPSGLVYLLGRKVKNLRHGWAVWSAMLIVFLVGALFCAHFEYQGNPIYSQLGCASSA